MCFHSKQSKKAQAVEKRFKAKVANPREFLVSDHINAFSFPKTPVILNDNPSVIQNINWGLIPAWAKNEDIRKHTINARLETITEKPSFKKIVENRCLIISTGFYEWQWQDKRGKHKKKYLIEVGQGELLAFGGLWSEWIDVNNGGKRRTYTMVTTKAKGIMKEIHNSKERMPIILTKENENNWLFGEPLSGFISLSSEVRAVKLDKDDYVLF